MVRARAIEKHSLQRAICTELMPIDGSLVSVAGIAISEFESWFALIFALKALKNSRHYPHP